MRRRTFLATGLTVASTGIAGCSLSDSRTEHTNPTVTHDDHDNAKYLDFRSDDTEFAIVGVEPNLAATPSSLFVSISHRVDTRLQSLTQRFVTPDSTEAQLRLSVHPPEDGESPNPPISLSQEEGAAVLEADEFGALADESVFMTLTVTHWPESARRLVVENTLELTETEAPDHTHVLDGNLEFTVDADTGANGSTTTSALNAN